jgi:hypothetical protein
MRETKKLKQDIENWIKKNGACDIDIKDEHIILYDGGLFYIESKKKKVPKIIGYKKAEFGREIMFSKTKKENYIENSAVMWIGELDDTIRYLKRLRNFLVKNKFNTRRDFKSLSMNKDKK